MVDSSDGPAGRKAAIGLLVGENGEKYERAQLEKQALDNLAKQDQRDRGEVESDNEAEESDASEDSADNDYNAEQYFEGGEDDGPSGDGASDACARNAEESQRAGLMIELASSRSHCDHVQSSWLASLP